ncbi:hypothetical protein ACKVWC_010063 [Pyricularia oryzae]
MIWLECLDRRPRVYSFDLGGRGGGRYPYQNVAGIQPAFVVYYKEERDLIAGSADRRTLSGICAESRKTVLKVFPDILRFENRGGWMSPDEHGFRNARVREWSGVCRYNSTLDVISLRLVRTQLSLFPKVMSVTVDPFPAFEAIQNLALVYEIDDDNILTPDYTYYPINAPHNPDTCACPDGSRITTCKEDMIPRFLKCFPSLKRLIVNDSGLRPCEYYWDEPEVIRFTGCKCFADPGDSSSAAPAKKHDVWQLVPIHNHRGHRRESACVALVYDEKTDCAGLNLDSFRLWDNIEINYKPLEHLVMRFLHPRDAQGRWVQIGSAKTPEPSNSPPAASEDVA